MSRTFVLQVGRSETFSTSTLLIDETLPNALSRLVEKRELPYGVTLYARVKCIDEDTGEGDWSTVISFKVRNPAKIIGVCLDSRVEPGTLNWIDEDGNFISNFEYQNHPTFYNTNMVTLTEAHNSVMTRIPRFYIRTALSGPVGSFAEGKKCWWLSNIESDGFRPHPAFKRSVRMNNEKYLLADYIYIGTYLGKDDITESNTGMIASKVNTTPLTNLSLDTFRSRCNAINTSNNTSGYHLFDIWDASAVKYLGLIAMGGGNSEEFWGTNSSKATDLLTGNTDSKLVLQGSVTTPVVWIDDMWAYKYYYVDKISTNGILQLISPMDGTTLLEFGSSDISKYMGSSELEYPNYFNDVMDCPILIGDDVHDLMELFLPKTYSSDYSKCAFTDHGYVSDGVKVAKMGGAPKDANTTAGLFNILINESGTSVSSDISARLACYA